MSERAPLAIAVVAASYRAGGHVARVTSRLRRGSSGGMKSPPTGMELTLENIRDAAVVLGVSVESLPGNFLKLSLGSLTSYCHSSDFAFESLVPYFLCGDKPLTSTLLREQGLPVPRSGSFELSRYDQAHTFFELLTKPVVVKPAQGTSSGLGVTLDIESSAAFRDGFARARAYGKHVVVEEQVEGDNFRVTILDGEILGSVRRIPARVLGDGVSSVRALVEKKNHLWRTRDPTNLLLGPISVDAEVRRLLRGVGMTMSSVPPKGQDVQLRRVSNADMGGEIEDMTNELHYDLQQIALRAAKALGAVLCGVDLIARNATRPAEPGSVFINEVNTTPGLYIANAMVGGRASTSASERILRYLFDFVAKPL